MSPLGDPVPTGGSAAADESETTEGPLSGIFRLVVLPISRVDVELGEKDMDHGGRKALEPGEFESFANFVERSSTIADEGVDSRLVKVVEKGAKALAPSI
jgi:hypothetical protein